MKYTFYMTFIFIGFIVGYMLRGFVDGEIPRQERAEFCKWVMQPKQSLDLSRVIRKGRMYCGEK